MDVLLYIVLPKTRENCNKMSQLVSGVIRPKGRIVVGFLEYIAPELFPEQREVIQEAVDILKEDKKRLKAGLSDEEAVWRLFERYCGKSKDLREILEVIPDYDRRGQPYRIGFRQITGNLNDLEVRIRGEWHPIETLHDGGVNFAITASDSLLAKFVTGLPDDIDVASPAIILENSKTTIKYAFPLKIAPSRHMLITSSRPEILGVDDRGLPLLKEGAGIAVNPEYASMYNYLFKGRYTLFGGFKVEPFLTERGKSRYGIEVVSSGGTLKEMAQAQYARIWVFRNPVYEAETIVLVNDARPESRRRYHEVTRRIREINGALQVPQQTTKAHMEENLISYLTR